MFLKRNKFILLLSVFFGVYSSLSLADYGQDLENRNLGGEGMDVSYVKSDINANFIEKVSSEEGVITTSSGLMYKVLTKGEGAKPTVNSTVTVNYEGKLIDGKIFDSSYQRGSSASFGVSDVIAGWTEALQLMPTGSTWELYIPPNLAYGERGVPGVIPPNSFLIFKVDLISIN